MISVPYEHKWSRLYLIKPGLAFELSSVLMWMINSVIQI